MCIDGWNVRVKLLIYAFERKKCTPSGVAYKPCTPTDRRDYLWVRVWVSSFRLVRSNPSAIVSNKLAISPPGDLVGVNNNSTMLAAIAGIAR